MWMGKDRQVTNTVDPCCLVVQEKESLGWREDPVLPSGTPYRAKPPISWCKSPPDRRALCLFLFKERGRPISLPGAYRFCVLIFQSSDLTAFYCSAPSSQQQEEPFPLLLDRLLDGEELGATAMTGGLGPCYAKPLPVHLPDGSGVPTLHSRPFRAGIGAHIRAAAVGPEHAESGRFPLP